MPEKVADTFLDARRRAWLRRRLLAWFGCHARELPWRRSRDPYPIWVSEIMLQQTQVATVIPYFQRFLKAFPNISALAQADLQHVLRHWEGLGYYRRARDLHQTARILHARHAGKIPDDAELLRTLPGLGRYTTNAVLSQAFNAKLPILEANSTRVLCRLLGVRQDPRAGPVQRVLWDAAARLLPTKQVGHFNQAMMELGALVCTPTTPACPDCPLALHCRARCDNTQDEIPYRAKEAAPTQVHEIALVLRRGGEVLLVQRPTSGRWASLWEFPHTTLLPGETSAQAAARLLAELGLKADLGDEIVTLKHTVTRFRITLVCLEAAYRSGKLKAQFYVSNQWLAPEDVAYLPVSSPQRRLVEAMGKRSEE